LHELNLHDYAKRKTLAKHLRMLADALDIFDNLCVSVDWESIRKRALEIAELTMSPPSPSMFPCICNIYALPAWTANTSQPQQNTDAEGGFVPSYPTAPTQANVPCSIQYQDATEETNRLGRVTQARLYHFFFANDPTVNPRDMIQWSDSSGVLRIAYVRASKDMGFFGVVFRVEAIERT